MPYRTHAPVRTQTPGRPGTAGRAAPATAADSSGADPTPTDPTPTDRPADAGTVEVTVAPDRTPAEEADLVARVAAAVLEDTGGQTVNLQLIETEHVTITGSVADRLQGTARWSA